MIQPTDGLEKKPYHSPELTIYGTLAELTQGGDGTTFDNEADPMGNPLRTG